MTRISRRSMPGAGGRRAVLALAVGVALVVVACGGSSGDSEAAGDASGGEARAGDGLSIVTTVAPLRSIIANVAGDRAAVIALVPEGTNSHTFEPPPGAVELLASADLVILNGLNLELPTLELARANAPQARVLLLGDSAIEEADYVFDFSFPAGEGNPNPHLWTAPDLSLRYAELVRDALVEVDPEGGDYYAGNLDRFGAQLRALDAAIAEATGTIPAGHRKLLTYHDSFPFFAPRYGLEIIGAVQPSDFSEPSPREVASLVEQIRAAGVPAIFGSEVFPSEVLEVIADEAGAVQVSTLRDDDLPGEPGDAENTLVAMLVENVRTMTTALGGDATALAGFDVRDTWLPYAQFLGEA